MKALIILTSILLAYSVCMAGNVKGVLMDSGNIFSAVTALFGAAGSIVWLLPRIRKIQESLFRCRSQTERFISKWRPVIEKSMWGDIRSLLISYDELTEEIALLLYKLRMRKAAKALREFIDPNKLQ